MPIHEAPHILAHRGASGWYPEGTELALAKALTVERDQDQVKGGSDVLEIDLRVSADGRLFLHHDESFRDTAGVDAKVSELDGDAIKRLNAGARFRDPIGRSYFHLGLRFLEIEEAFALFPDQHFNIEMKEKWDQPPLNRLLLAIQQASVEGKVVLASQEKSNLAFFRERDFPTSASRFELASAISAATLGFGLGRPAYQIIQAWFPRVLSPNRIVDFFKERGVETHFWTVNARERIREAVESGAGGIITNFPGRVYEELALRGLRPAL